MSKRVLIGFDGSDPSRRAVTATCEQFPDADLFVVTVANPMAYHSRDTFKIESSAWREEFESEAAEILEVAETMLEDRDRSFTGEVLIGRPGRALVEFIETHSIDHVVIGSHGRRGVERFLVGSVAKRLLETAPADLTVIR